MIDDSSKYHLPAEASHPGAQALLSRSEVVILAVFGQWSQFKSERGFSRSALTQFIVLVKLPSGRGLTLSQAYQLLTAATRIQAVLVCH